MPLGFDLTVIIPILVRNETYSIPESPPSLRLRSGQAQPSPIKEERVPMVDPISIISNYKRYYSFMSPHVVVTLLFTAGAAFLLVGTASGIISCRMEHIGSPSGNSGLTVAHLQ